MTIRSLIKISLLFVLILSSCGKDGIDGINGINGKDGKDGVNAQSLTGEAIGFVNLYEIEGTLIKDRSGVTISVEGNTNSTTSDSNGRFVLSNLKTGTYNLVFSKQGFGTGKYIGFQFVAGGGGQTLTSAILSKIPSFNVTGLTAKITSGIITLTGSLSGTLPTGSKYVMIFAGTTSNVSSTPANYLYYQQISIEGTSTTLSTTLYTTLFSKGQTIYVNAYASPINYYAGWYIDLITGRYNWPSLGTTSSNIVSVVVP